MNSCKIVHPRDELRPLPRGYQCVRALIPNLAYNASCGTARTPLRISIRATCDDSQIVGNQEATLEFVWRFVLAVQ